MCEIKKCVKFNKYDCTCSSKDIACFGKESHETNIYKVEIIEKQGREVYVFYFRRVPMAV